MALLGLHFRARAFSSCGERGPLLIAVRGPLPIAASLVAEHRLQTRRLSSCGSRAQLLRGMWDLLRLGLEPVSPALAGRFSTTAPPGKPQSLALRSCASIHTRAVKQYITLKHNAANLHTLPHITVKHLYPIFQPHAYVLQFHFHLLTALITN